MTVQTVDTIIRAKWVLPVYPNNTILNNHSVIINEGKIIDICSHQIEQQKYKSEQKHHLSTHAVLPSFVNCHTHLAMSYFRGLGDDRQLMDWLSNYIWPAEAATVSAKLVYDGTRHALLESIRGGVGCVNDHYFYMDQVVDALSESGIRGVVGNCILKFGMPWAPDMDHCFEQAKSLGDYVADHTLVTSALAPHSPYGTDDQAMDRCCQWSKQSGCKVHIHLHESATEVSDYRQQNEGYSPVEKFYEKGWLNKDMIAVHMTQLTDEEIQLVRHTNASVVHCPESNMKLASGIAPVQKMLDAGINVALGTDGSASNNDIDMIGEMRSAAFLGKVSTSDPSALSAENVLKMATYNGAKALGMSDQIGSLEKGKCADIIAIDLDRPETTPVYNAISQIVYSSTREQVTHMWINGRPIMNDRQILTMDELTVQNKCIGWAEQIVSAIDQSD